MNSQEAVLCNPQEIPNLEGMLFVRIVDTLNRMVKAPLVLFGLLLTVVLPINSFGNTPRTVDFTVYPDGTTHIYQETMADPQSVNVSVQLFGSAIENFVAQDQDGLLLSYEILGNVAKIDTFGATRIFVSYDSYDLVTKNGRVWTFRVDSPIAYTLTLPQNTVIVGMSSIPESVLTVDEQPRLSLPGGPNDVDYFFGVSGRGSVVGNLINEANETVNRLNSQGIATLEIKEKLSAAKKAFEERRYDQAEALVNEIRALALAAENTTVQPPGSSTFDGMTGALVAAVVGGAVAIALVVKRKIGTKAKTETIARNNDESDFETDDEAISQEMREDDKRLVEFLAQNGGQAFERDMRKKFLLPRTTMWRAVKRLERQGIIEIEKKDFQNLVKLKKREGEQ
jgi:uncharacterized membrane protein